MRQQDILAVLTEMEEDVPVDEWLVDGIRIWPLARALLGWNLNQNSCETSDRELDRSRRFTRESVSLLGRWCRCFVHSLKDESGRAERDASSDLVVLGDGISKIFLSGRWYDRLAEPLIEVCAEAGMTAIHLEPGYQCIVPRHVPSHFIQPSLDAAWLRSRLRRRDPRVELPGYERFTGVERAAGLTPTFSAKRLVRSALAVQAYASYFQPLLRGRFGIVTVESSPIAMALNLAASQAGVVSVELQHGFQGRQNWVYSCWTRIPREGYELLPDVYWTWSPRDAAEIERWAGRTRAHEAVVGGNLWLRKWAQHKTTDMARDDAEVSALVSSAPASHHVLVTLQSRLHQAVLPQLLVAMRETQDEMVWWFRLHPTTDPEEEVTIRRLLIGNGVDAQSIDKASSLPLYSWLARVAVQVTHSSASVLEASSLGLPSVVVSNEGFDFYQPYVPEGLLKKALTAKEIVSQVRELVVAREAPSPRFPDPVPLVRRLFIT